ncbi:hypothetical protein BGZ58_006497 [Dissophora ornata]|nr:hypothetical protein BGZ58_006497 [Dissophora ornata]
MVLSRSDPNTSYRGKDVPETPLTPRTPLSPPLHRSRLMTPTLSRPSATRSARKRERAEDDDLDLDHDPAQGLSSAAYQLNAKPTPSELLSMNLNTLALHQSSSGSSSIWGTPSARLSDDAIGHLNLSLPFEKFLTSSCPSPSFMSSGNGSLETVHRYPSRSPIRASKSAQSTPTKTRPILNNKLATPPSSAITQRTALVSPPRSNNNRGQFMTDEENNLFLSHSPRAVRTPRRTQSRTDQFSPALLSETPVPAPNLLLAFAEQDIETGLSSSISALNDSLFVDEDDKAETESVQSPTRGDLEKENHTPKISEEFANPFYVGGAPLSELRRSTRSSLKADGPTTPAGPSTTTGSMIRSKRQALGSISPWRWNTFNEQAALSFFSGTKGVKGLGPVDATSGPCSKAGYAVSDWVESVDPQKSATMSSEPAETSSAASSSSISKSCQAVGGKSLSSSSSSSSSTTSLLGPALGARGAATKLPDDHPNSAESADRKGGPSSLVAKLTESVIQPHAVAFNRRAQQVAGQIYYWKHGSYQLVSEQDKQQWPGEWKFEIYQDPQSPGGPSQCESSLAGSTGATYTGKGKLTDRQLSGPGSKRMRTHREPLGGLSDMSSSSALQQHDREPSGDTGTALDREETPPPSPSHRASMMRQETSQLPKQSRLQDRYDFRERRMLDEPLTPRSRRCGA